MRAIFRSRPFWTAFLATVLVFALFFALLAVDSAGRRRSFNDTSPPFVVTYEADGTAKLTVNAFSWRHAFNVTGIVKCWHFIAEFFCLPHGELAEPTAVPAGG